MITIWITGDQCSMSNTALACADKSDAVVLLIESIERGKKLKYHKKKLVLIYSIMRHFADELEASGWRVDYHKESPSFKGALDAHLKKYKPSSIIMMEQSEYGANESLASMLRPEVKLEFTPHCNFISTREDFEKLHKQPDSRVTMEVFYRMMRKKTGLLMNGPEPEGGLWNYDKNNRLPPDKNLSAKPVITFEADKITQAVINMVDNNFFDHPGTTKNWQYAVTAKDAELAACDFIKNRLDLFGPHQDAMLEGKPFLNHSVLSPYINTCLLHPLSLARAAEQAYRDGQVSLSSCEGFIRQLIGWREYIFRVYWRLMPEYKMRNSLCASNPLPQFFNTGNTRMRCMSDSINTTIEHGYTHHIVRLMLLGNFSMLAGLNPLSVNDWFTEMFVDAYDWVMVPNVIGMTLHADNGYVGTKPYAASANYINKMSNYCKKCEYNPKESVGMNACPFNSLYWNFLMRHENAFQVNHRMTMVMKNLAGRPDHWRAEIEAQANKIISNLDYI